MGPTAKSNLFGFIRCGSPTRSGRLLTEEILSRGEELRSTERARGANDPAEELSKTREGFVRVGTGGRPTGVLRQVRKNAKRQGGEGLSAKPKSIATFRN